MTEPQEPPPGPSYAPTYSASGYGPPPGFPPGPPPGYPPVPPQGYPPYGYSGYGAPGYAGPGYGPGYGPPPGHLGWAITALVFFWPLAIAAFINYARVESCFYRGDLAGAQRASGQVRKFGIIALIVGPCLVILYVAVALIVLSNSGCGIDASC